MTIQYSIILADDHDILLDSLEGLMKDEPDLKVVDKVKSGQELIESVQQSFPDLCIVDLDMPGMNGMVASEKLIAAFPDICILILSMHSEPSLIKNMMKIGIKGYLTKTSDRDEFIFAIRQILQGKTHFSDDLVSSTFKSETEKANEGALAKIAMLSKKEREIVKWICRGLTNKQIGEKLYLSHKTVDNHRTSIMRKLDVHNVVELIRFSIKNGLSD